MWCKVAFFCISLPLWAENTALVAALSGTVSSSKSPQVAAYDWIPDGAILRTDAKSSVTVILLNGRRFELGPRARATIGAAGLSATSGPVKELDRIPPIPKAAPLAIATDTAAAGAFRGAGKIEGLSPRNAALAGPVTFSFKKVEGATAYRMVVEDANGDSIADETTQSTEISVPLQAGARYTWRVRAMGASEVVAENQAAFVTLSNEQLQARQAFADKIRTLPGGLALLAEVDAASGLSKEAIDEFREALKLKPHDPDMERRLAALVGK